MLRLLRDLRDAIEHPATFAAGLVPDDARTPEELVAHADARLLAQKRDGKLRQPILSVRGRALSAPAAARAPSKRKRGGAWSICTYGVHDRRNPPVPPGRGATLRLA